ncbi:NUDIX hydrolase [Sporolactobacillus sp. THM19-2]|uniref:NUDIX hydrolase n=1 Tax=Sporolactobacillus sp. THM19-2 TaxID=2511171 RepID=UPI001021294D|nr:NUDIX hydrolase [Sporolactobacillus sp. THM19-2]RYL93353.1 NUDIX hydrolase [Sporolactobacillus sp. THM19-2]
MSDRLTEQKTDSKELFRGEIVHLFLDTVALPDGRSATREVVKHPGAVAIIAVNDQGKLLLVRQYRYPLDGIIYEIPAGKLEPGENPDHSAHRELEEETGYQCTQLEKVASFYSSPGFSDELLHIYFTDTLTPGRQHLDDDEFLEVCAVSLEEAERMVVEHQIADAKSVYAVQYLRLLALQGRKLK